jgi:streptogramin lyase
MLTEKSHFVDPLIHNNVPKTSQKFTTPQIEGYSTIPLEKAYAISSNQTIVNVTQWSISDGAISAFDSQGNFFTKDASTKIGRGDIITENHTQWVLPNNNVLQGAIGVNSTGMPFFGQISLDDTVKIGTLDHNTDTFTEWIVPNFTSISFINVDSSDNVFFFGAIDKTWYVARLVPSNNTFTFWCCLGNNLDTRDPDIDSSGKLFWLSGKQIIQFNPETKTKTSWPMLSENNFPAHSVDVDDNGIIYFMEEIPIQKYAIGKLDPNNQTIKEWIIPQIDDFGTRITADSSGNVFFGKNDLGRLNTSNNTVTIWSTPSITELEIDSSGTIFWSRNSLGGTIT